MTYRENEHNCCSREKEKLHAFPSLQQLLYLEEYIERYIVFQETRFFLEWILGKPRKTRKLL